MQLDMARIETLIMIPVADNDRVPFDDAAFVELHRRLAAVAEGSTRRGPPMGFWIDPADGAEYNEAVFEYEIDLESWLSIPAFIEVALWARHFFRQRAILIKIAGVPEIL